ncbi:MAG: ParB/RepB/Spo0J family partition protein, partial [Nitrospiria bacterium]
HPNEPRTYIDPDSLQELKNNIAKIGLIHPITVTPRPEGGYTRLAGRRRLLASQALGHETLPAHVRTGLTPEQIETILLSENLQRVDLSPVEEAETFAQLLQTRSIEDLSAYINRSADYIRRRLQLGQLEQSVRNRLLSGAVTLSVAEQLACLPQERQKAVLTMVEEQGLNGVQLSNLLILQNNRDLQTAPFETSDCMNCPHNSAGQPELFARERSGLGRCLDDRCWREKEGEKAKSLVKQIEEMGPRAVITERLKIALKDLPADIDPTQSVIHNKAELGESNLCDCQSCNFLVVFISNMGHLLKQNICTRKSCYQERAASFRADHAGKESPALSIGGQGSPTSERSPVTSSREAGKSGLPEKMTPANAPQRVKEYKRKRYDDCLMEAFAGTDEHTLRLAMIAMGNSVWVRDFSDDPLLKELSSGATGPGAPIEIGLLKGTRSRNIEALFHIAGRMAARVIPKLRLETVEQMLFVDLKKRPEELFSLDQAYLELLTKREIEATAKALGLDPILKGKGLSIKKLSNQPKKKLIEGVLRCGSGTSLPRWLQPETIDLR